MTYPAEPSLGTAINWMSVMPVLPIAPRLIAANDPPPNYNDALKQPQPSSLPVENVENREPLRAWQRERIDERALAANDPRLFHPACGVMPTKLMKELQQVQSLLESMNLKSITESRRAQLALDKAKANLEVLKQLPPEPSAPLVMTVGGAFFDDSTTNVDVIHQKTLRGAEKKVVRLDKELQALEKKFHEQREALQLKKLKLEAELRTLPTKAAAAAH